MFLAPGSFLLAVFFLAGQPVNPNIQPSAATTAQDQKPEHPEWSYSGPNGPDHWADNYPDCGGKHQSPINITGAAAAQLPKIQFHYRASPLFIVNNGHTIQISFPPKESPDNTIDIGGVKYRLVQFHFHQPSEEHLHGHSSEMVVHLVHQRGEGADMRLAVVAVLLRLGTANPLIHTLWQHIPADVSHEPVEVPGVTINAANLVPPGHGYYTYHGSLTTPPCTEIVTWYILKAPIAVSPGQVEAFKKYYSNNARPVQPLNGRKVQQTQ
jgi:carbonic anhydrase